MASVVFVGAMLVATAGTLYPTILRSTVAPRYSLDAYNTSAHAATLVIGLIVWIPAMVLAIGYFVFFYRSFRGKVEVGDSHY